MEPITLSIASIFLGCPLFQFPEEAVEKGCENLQAKEPQVPSSSKNIRAGEKIVLNALYCLKRGSGAEDFLGLNEKDLVSDIKNTATKK